MFLADIFYTTVLQIYCVKPEENPLMCAVHFNTLCSQEQKLIGDTGSLHL